MKDKHSYYHRNDWCIQNSHFSYRAKPSAAHHVATRQIAQKMGERNQNLGRTAKSPTRPPTSIRCSKLCKACLQNKSSPCSCRTGRNFGGTKSARSSKHSAAVAGTPGTKRAAGL